MEHRDRFDARVLLTVWPCCSIMRMFTSSATQGSLTNQLIRRSTGIGVVVPRMSISTVKAIGRLVPQTLTRLTNILRFMPTAPEYRRMPPQTSDHAQRSFICRRVPFLPPTQIRSRNILRHEERKCPEAPYGMIPWRSRVTPEIFEDRLHSSMRMACAVEEHLCLLCLSATLHFSQSLKEGLPGGIQHTPSC